MAANASRLNGPSITTFDSNKFAKPVLEMITFCAALVLLIICALKTSAAGLTLIAGTGMAVPVPESCMLCGEPGALLVIVTAPCSPTAVSGVNVMLTAQLPAGATEALEIGQVLVKPKSPVP